jgi:hypothetical protein
MRERPALVRDDTCVNERRSCGMTCEALTSSFPIASFPYAAA